MAAFLLWNTGGKRGKNLDSLVQNLVREHGVDVLLLVEYYPSIAKSTLSTLLISDGLVRRNTSDRFGVFSRTTYGAPDPFGPVTKIRYNCYVRVISKAYLHLLFQVTTPSSSAFDAEIGTPEGDKYPPVKNESELVATITQVLQRQRTKDVIEYLLRVAVP